MICVTPSPYFFFGLQVTYPSATAEANLQQD